MELNHYESARLFLDKTAAVLESREAENNLMLGLLYAHARQEVKGQLAAMPYMATVDNSEGRPVLIVLLNAVNLIAYGEGPQLEQAVRLLVSKLAQMNRDVPGVVGPVEAARQIATEWAAARGKTPYVRMNQRIYRLDRVNPVRMSPGKLRLADQGDSERIAGWIHEFAESIEEKMSREVAAAKARDHIAGSTMYLWEDGQPVSMVKKSRSTRNGIVLSLVYTPPDQRGKGYATSCVASLSQLLLDEGRQFCSLYTDLSNPTSNGIYMNIGYNPIQDSIMYRFQP